ncbi:MAG: radical SAM protein, partial [bacterium]|nr:radical SAM protein [bacterium]
MKPILCNYYITYRCNSRCLFCDIWKRPQRSDLADCSLNHVYQNLRQLSSAGVKFVDFTGGEPLLHSRLPDMLMFARSLGMITSVTTNCLLYPSRTAELSGKIDLLHFSLDTLDESEYQGIRGVAGLKKVLQSLDLAEKLGEKADLLFTVTNENYRAIDKLIRLAAERKLILIVNPLFNCSPQQRLSLSALNYIEQFRSERYVYINRALHRLIRTGGNDIGHPRCRSVDSAVVISPDNKLLLPCFHHQRAAIPINDSLEQILKSPVVNSFRKKQGRFPQCQGCTINCYFDPSFLYTVDEFFWLSLISKIKYARDKY